MRLELRRANGEMVGHHVRLGEYEPLAIRFVTGRNVNEAPNVTLDGASIGEPKVTMGRDEIIWEWQFRSESWCGRCLLTLSSDVPPIDITVQSVPSGTKYSEDEYERMLNRLLAYNTNVLWGVAPGQDAAKDGAPPGPTIAHPALVDCYLDALLVQLDRVLIAPVLATFREETVRALDPTRPLKPHTLRWLAARPMQLRRVRCGDLEVGILQQRHVATYDHPANRYVVTLVSQLCSMFERSASAIATLARKRLVGDLEKARSVHLSLRLRTAGERLRATLDSSVLADVRSGPMSEGVAQVFADQPNYARFGILARRLLKNGIQRDAEGDLLASLRRSWDLFEIYCLHRLVETLQTALGPSWVFDTPGYRQHVLCTPAEGCFWQANHPSGERWELLYQQWFARGASGANSITTGRQPDFVLCRYVGESLKSWVLLDAKYRSSELSLNDALESMHIYRDSLRWTAAQDIMPANAGYLLVPQIATRLEKYASDGFLDRWGIGLIDIDTDTLGSRLIRDRECDG